MKNEWGKNDPARFFLFCITTEIMEFIKETMRQRLWVVLVSTTAVFTFEGNIGMESLCAVPFFRKNFPCISCFFTRS